VSQSQVPSALCSTQQLPCTGATSSMGSSRSESESSEDDAVPAAVAVAAVRQPPPESRASRQTRQLVILSFWLVVIVLGVPLWHVTTAIYRAPLPLREMEAWDDGKVG